jgi:hypothetical protein
MFQNFSIAEKMQHNVEYKNSSRLRGTFLSSYKKVEAGYNP